MNFKNKITMTFDTMLKTTSNCNNICHTLLRQMAVHPMQFMAMGLFLLLCAAPAFAQQTTPPSMNLSLIKLGDMTLPDLFVVQVSTDSEGKSKSVYDPIDIGEGAESPSVNMPITTPMQIYVGETNETTGKATYKPYLQIPNATPDANMLLIFYQDDAQKTQSKFVDKSPKIQPVQTVRMLNLSSRRIAFSVGEATVPVQPNAEMIAKPKFTNDGNFTFQYFEEINGKPQSSNIMNLFFPSPEMRLLILYVKLPFTTPDPSGALMPDGTTKNITTYRSSTYSIYDTVKTKK